MGRHRKEGLSYFSFEVNLDYKWQAIEAVHGLEGFAVCVKIYQECYKTDSGELDISSILRRKILEKNLNCGEELLNRVLETALEVGMFDKNTYDDKKVLTSNGIKKRIDAVGRDRKSARIRSEKSSSANKNRSNAESVPKEKNRIVKNRKEKKTIKQFIPPEFEVFNSYCIENKFGHIAKRAFDGYAVNDWKDSNNKPITNWKQKLIQVWFNERNQLKGNQNGQNIGRGGEASQYDNISEVIQVN